MRVRVDKLIVCILTVLPLLALSFAGCARTGSSNPNASKPPQIPPASSFVMDFADFASSNNTTFNPQIREGNKQLVSLLVPNGSSPSVHSALGDRSNWGFAALNVGFWNIIGFLGLAVPVAAFVESFDHIPVQKPDYTWAWTYSVTVQNTVYTAELDGRYIDRGVRWEMYVTKQNEYSNFLWYYGESNLPATHGYWVLKNKPADPTDLLRIDWHRDVANNTGDIKYINIVPGGPENGGYISYAVTAGDPYDRSYTIYNKGKNESTYIEWNSSTKEGRVKDSLHFGDNNWHYWDSQLKDIESS